MALNEDKIIINVVAQVNDSELNKGLNDIKKEVDAINKSDDLDIKINTTIDGVNSASSLKDLKTSLRELQGLALEVGENNQEALNKINIAAGQAKDKIGDLRDGFNSLSGSPIENVATSFSSLKQKITSLDLEGVKQQFGNLKLSLGQVAEGLFSSGEAVGGVSKMFGGLKTAIAATGLGILLIVVGSVIANFDNLKGSGGLLGKVFTTLGDVVSYVTGLFTKFTDAIGLTDIASQKLADTTAANNKKINDSYQDSLDFQVAYLKARGLNTEEAERKAQSQREQSARQNIIDLKAQGKLQGEEAEKAFSELRKQKEASIILDATLDKKAIDDAKEAADKKNEAYKKSLEDKKKIADDARKKEEQAAKDAQTKQDTLDQIELINSKDKETAEIKLLSEKIVRYENYSKKELDNLKITEEQKQLVIAQSYARIDEITQGALDRDKKEKKEQLERVAKLRKDAEDKRQKEEDDSRKARKARADREEAETKRRLENQEKLIDDYTQIFDYKFGTIFGNLSKYMDQLKDAFLVFADFMNATIDEKITASFEVAGAALKAIGESIGGVAGSVIEGVGNIADKVGEAVKTFSDESASMSEKIVAGLEIANSLVGTIGEALQKTTDENIAANDRETKKRLKNLDQRAKTEKLTEAQIAQAKYAIQVDAYNKDLALRKKAFQQQKAIQIVQAVIGTAQGIVSALANPFPLNIVMASLAGVVGAVNIGLIAAQKFPEGDGPPSAPTPAPIPPPSDKADQIENKGPDNNFIAPQFFGLGGKQLSDGQDSYQKVYVVESDITGMQKKVNVIEDRARIGG